MLGSYIITTSNQKSLLQFNIELLVYLTLASKENSSSSRGRPPKRKSLEAPTTGKKPTLWSLIYGGGGGGERGWNSRGNFPNVNSRDGDFPKL